MREILFRAKADYNSDWVFGDLLHSKGKVGIQTEEGTRFLVKPETVGQYTGLNDCDGKKIFEGDVLLFPSFAIDDEEFPAYYMNVCWGDGGWLARSALGYEEEVLDTETASRTTIVDTIHDMKEARL